MYRTVIVRPACQRSSASAWFPKGEAERAYHAWVAAYLGDDSERLWAFTGNNGAQHTTKDQPAANVATEPGSILHIASGLIRYEEGRIRKEPGKRVTGTISPQVAADRKKDIKDFLAFLNHRHGDGAVGQLRLADLTLLDVEAYNQYLVPSASRLTP